MTEHLDGECPTCGAVSRDGQIDLDATQERAKLEQGRRAYVAALVIERRGYAQRLAAAEAKLAGLKSARAEDFEPGWHEFECTQASKEIERQRSHVAEVDRTLRLEGHEASAPRVRAERRPGVLARAERRS